MRENCSISTCETRFHTTETFFRIHRNLNREPVRKKKPYFLYLIIGVAILLAFGSVYRIASTYHKAIAAKDEKSLKVTIDAGFCDVSIGRGTPNRILDADIDADLPESIDRYIDYSDREGVGYLSINTTETVSSHTTDHHGHHSFSFKGFEHNAWDLRFTDAVPISFDMELGMGKGDFDFTGLAVNDLNLSAGASSVSVRFDQPNKTTMNEMTIETGLSKFHGEGLCNARFRRFKFQGGVGSYSLDFSGPLEHDVNIDIEVGLGSITVIIPENAGAKIYYEKSLISHIGLPHDFSEREENTYYSSNYRSSSARMDMHIEAGLGSVTIRRE